VRTNSLNSSSSLAAAKKSAHLLQFLFISKVVGTVFPIVFMTGESTGIVVFSFGGEW